MKFSLAIIVYLVLGVVLGLGILMAIKGSYGLLIASSVVYILGFARIGCATH